jgi:hypothetical protein
VDVVVDVNVIAHAHDHIHDCDLVERAEIGLQRFDREADRAGMPETRRGGTC